MSNFPQYVSKELIQPNRNFDMIDSEKEDEEEDDYDMNELVKMTANIKTWSDVLTLDKNKSIKKNIKNNIN